MSHKERGVSELKQRKYAIHPNWVQSKWDGQWHYIGYGQLISLYNLNPRECFLWDERRPETYLGRNRKDYKHIYPRDNDNYPSMEQERT